MSAPPTRSGSVSARQGGDEEPAPAAATSARSGAGADVGVRRAGARLGGALHVPERVQRQAARDQQERQQAEEHPAPADDLAHDRREATGR